MKKTFSLLIPLVLVLSLCGCGKTAKTGQDVEKLLLESNAVTTISFDEDYMKRDVFLADGTCYDSFKDEKRACPVISKPASNVSALFILFDKYLDANFDESIENIPIERCALFVSLDGAGDVLSLNMHCGNSDYSIYNNGSSEIYLYDSSCAYSIDKNGTQVSTNRYETDTCVGDDASLATKGIGVFNKLFADIGITAEDLRTYVKWFLNEYSTSIIEQTMDAQTLFKKLGVKVYSHFDNDDYYYSIDNRAVDSEGDTLWGTIPEKVNQAHVVIMLDTNNKITLGTSRTDEVVYDDGYSYSENMYLKYTTDGSKGEYYFCPNEEKEYVKMKNGCYYDIAGTVQNAKKCSNNDEAERIVESYKLWQKEIGMDSSDFIIFGVEFMDDYTNPLMEQINADY